MTLRIEVDRVLCEGHGLCELTAPDVYALDDEGYAHPVEDPLPADREKAAEAGARVCPVAAVRITRS